MRLFVFVILSLWLAKFSYSQSLDGCYLFAELEKNNTPFPTHGLINNGNLKSVSAQMFSIEIENGDTIVIPEVIEIEEYTIFTQTYSKKGLPEELKDVWIGEKPFEFVKTKNVYDDKERLLFKVNAIFPGFRKDSTSYFYNDEEKNPSFKVRHFTDWRGNLRSIDTVYFLYKKDEIFNSGRMYHMMDHKDSIKLVHSWDDQKIEDVSAAPKFGRDTTHIQNYKTQNKQYGLKFKCKTEHAISSFDKRLLLIKTECNDEKIYESVYEYNDQGLLKSIVKTEYNGENSYSILLITYEYEWH